MRIIDHAKRAALSKLLLENVTSTAPGEKLDEKLAGLAFTPEETERTYSPNMTSFSITLTAAHVFSSTTQL